MTQRREFLSGIEAIRSASKDVFESFEVIHSADKFLERLPYLFPRGKVSGHSVHVIDDSGTAAQVARTLPGAAVIHSSTAAECYSSARASALIACEGLTAINIVTLQAAYESETIQTFAADHENKPADSNSIISWAFSQTRIEPLRTISAGKSDSVFVVSTDGRTPDVSVDGSAAAKIQVRVSRPWNDVLLSDAIPAGARVVVVDENETSTPLLADVVSSLRMASNDAHVSRVSSFGELSNTKTISATDEPAKAVFWDTSNTLNANVTRASCTFIGENLAEQCRAVPFSDFSGSVTRTVVLFGSSATAAITDEENDEGTADYVQCNHLSILFQRTDVLDGLKRGGTFVLCASFGAETASTNIPEWTKQILASKRAKFFVFHGSAPAGADLLLLSVFSMRSVPRTHAFDGKIEEPTLTPAKSDPATPSGSYASSVSSSGASYVNVTSPWREIVSENVTAAIQAAEQTVSSIAFSRLVFPRSWSRCSKAAAKPTAELFIGPGAAAGSFGKHSAEKLINVLRTLFGKSAKIEDAFSSSAGSTEFLLGKLLAAKKADQSAKWIVAGDELSYDFSGLHHVLASGENINLLVIDTDKYSAPSRTRDEKRLKKDIGLYAMNYGSAYVASVVGESESDCDRARLLKELSNAAEFPGPSVVLAFSPSDGAGERQRAIENGNWPLYSFDPRKDDDALQVVSEKVRGDIKAFMDRENTASRIFQNAPTFETDRSLDADIRKAALDQFEALSAGLATGGVASVPVSLLILYGSDGGNATSLAGSLQTRAEARGATGIRVAEANDVTLEEMADYENVALVLATAGQGEACNNAKTFCDELFASEAKLQNSFAVFGLGDSHYWGKGSEDSAKYFCLPAKMAHEKMLALGSTPLVPLALGDDQHPAGFNGAFDEFLPSLLSVLGLKPVPGEEEAAARAKGSLPADDDLKRDTNYLRGTIAKGIEDRSTQAMLPRDIKLTKFHGIYMQDDRDIRQGLIDAGKERDYRAMIRIGLPGGVGSAKQYLVMEKLANELGNGTLKLTTRQAYQLHGVLKWNLKKTIRDVNKALMSSLAACGDVNRNVMASPNPHFTSVGPQINEFARNVSNHLLPKTSAYSEIWLTDSATGKKKLVAGNASSEVEPLYGKSYLPRKFKIAIAVPPQNDVDVFAHCLGFIAIVNPVTDELEGFNVAVGGGMGMTHGNEKTFPCLSQILGFCTVEQGVKVAEAVLLTQRDHGDRKNRKHARLKYTLRDHGIDWFRDQVESRAGFKLGVARPFTFEKNSDHYGWHKDSNGTWSFGMFIENGRIKDTDSYKLMTGLREIAKRDISHFYLTANQNLILANIADQDKPTIEELLSKYGIDNERYSNLRLHSMACVALPTCGLAMAESERYLPSLVSKLDDIMDEAGLDDSSITIRMTGCPNGCARAPVAEIGFIGKAPGQYNLYLGGGFSGNRLSKLYREGVNEEQILEILAPMLFDYAQSRFQGEHFGDFCIRAGYIHPTLRAEDFHKNVGIGYERNDDFLSKSFGMSPARPISPAVRLPTPSGSLNIYW